MSPVDPLKDNLNSQHNDKYIQALNNQIKVLSEVSESIVGHINLDEILSIVLNKLVLQLGYTFSGLFLLDDTGKMLKLKKAAVSGFVKTIFDVALGSNLLEVYFDLDDPDTKKCMAVTPVLDGQISISSKISDFSIPKYVDNNKGEVISRLSGIKFLVGLPIIVNDKRLGTLIVATTSELGEKDKSVLFTFANQISIAIYNSQLFEKVNNQVTLLQIKNRDLQSLFNLTSNVGKSLVPDIVTQTAVDTLPQDENMIGSLITLYEKDKNILRVKAVSKNAISEQAQKIVGNFDKLTINLDDPESANTTGVLAIKMNTPLYSNKLEDIVSPPVPKSLVPALEKLLNISSVVVYPINPRGELLGTISFYLRNKSYDEFDENQKQLLDTYALQIAIALENAMLFNRSETIQRNLQAALSNLEEARRRERDMIDVMGHELRTPISIVRNAVVVLQSDFKKGKAITQEKLGKYLDMATESIRREVTLIETLLSSAKLEGKRVQLVFTKVDLTDAVNDGIEALKHTAVNKKVELKFTPPTEPIFVYADRVRTQEIVDNFLSNAIKYTPEGYVEIKIGKEANMARVDIKDSGVGISAEDIKKLGRKFYRAKNYFSNENSIVAPSGTGLGLFVTFALIKIMHGEKYIVSEVGKGSTFSFTLPIYQGEADKRIDQTFLTE